MTGVSLDWGGRPTAPITPAWPLHTPHASRVWATAWAPWSGGQRLHRLRTSQEPFLGEGPPGGHQGRELGGAGWPQTSLGPQPLWAGMALPPPEPRTLVAGPRFVVLSVTSKGLKRPAPHLLGGAHGPHGRSDTWGEPSPRAFCRLRLRRRALLTLGAAG